MSYDGGRMAWGGSAGAPAQLRADERGEAAAEARYASALAEAHAVAKVASSELRRNTGAPLAGQSLGELLPPEAAHLRWFVLPAEAAAMHKGRLPAARAPFAPPAFAQADAARALAPHSVAAAAGGGEAAAAGQPGAGEAKERVGGRGNAGKKKKGRKGGGGGGDGWVEPDKKLSNKVFRAVLQHGMLRPGDRVLVGLSGGKDSLCMLHVLRALQKRTPFQWDLGACTVDPKADGFDPSPLVPYLEGLGIPYFYEAHNLMALAEPCMAKEGNRVSICSFCSRMKRGVLYATARREGYNVLAMAQHLDDLAESFFMSALHNGALRSMKTHYLIDAADLRVIRPLAYVREAEAEAFAESNHLPVVSETCPACFEAPKERYRVKCLLATQEALFPALFQSLLKTILPLTEPLVEDVVRLRREAYGRAAGPPHVPPPMPPPREGALAEMEAAARKAHEPAGVYDARALWRAALAVSRQRLGGSAKGRGGEGDGDGAAAAAAAAALEEEDLSASWFGGHLDENGNFTRGGGGGGAQTQPRKEGSRWGEGRGAPAAGERGVASGEVAPGGSWQLLALGVAWSLGCIAWASVSKARAGR